MGARRVLVADDEENVRYVAVAALRMAGFDVLECETGRETLTLATAAEGPDLVVLDVMLPDLNGFEVCRRLRLDRIETPVIFLTTLGEHADRLRGLTIGGDDYLVKPFSVEELVLRVQVVLRRVGKGADQSVLRAGAIALDDAARRVTKGGVEVRVSPTEYRLLRYLMENQGLAVSRSQILDRVWSYDFEGESTVLDTFMSSLRRKVEGEGPKLIHTVRGVGYRLEAE